MPKITFQKERGKPMQEKEKEQQKQNQYKPKQNKTIKKNNVKTGILKFFGLRTNLVCCFMIEIITT